MQSCLRPVDGFAKLTPPAARKRINDPSLRKRKRQHENALTKTDAVCSTFCHASLGFRARTSRDEIAPSS